MKELEQRVINQIAKLEERGSAITATLLMDYLRSEQKAPERFSHLLLILDEFEDAHLTSKEKRGIDTIFSLTEKGKRLVKEEE